MYYLLITKPPPPASMRGRGVPPKGWNLWLFYLFDGKPSLWEGISPESNNMLLYNINRPSALKKLFFLK